MTIPVKKQIFRLQVPGYEVNDNIEIEFFNICAIYAYLDGIQKYEKLW